MFYFILFLPIAFTNSVPKIQKNIVRKKKLNKTKRKKKKNQEKETIGLRENINSLKTKYIYP